MVQIFKGIPTYISNYLSSTTPRKKIKQYLFKFKQVR